jgi:hypothetical protein
MTHKGRVVLFALVLAMLTSACTINLNTQMDADGAGIWQIEMGLTAEDQQFMSELEMSSEEFCEQTAADELAGEFTVTLEQRDDMDWCLIAQPFSSISELRAMYSDGNSGITVNELAITDGVLSYNVTVDLTDGGEADLSESGIELSMNWLLDVPGEVISTNAHSQDGGVLIWELTPGSTQQIQAEVDLGGGGIAAGGNLIYLVLCCLCLLVVVIGGGAAGYFIYRQRQSTDSGESVAQN